MDINQLARLQADSLEAVMGEIQKTHDRIHVEQLRTQIAFGAVVEQLELLTPDARQRMLATIEGVRLGLLDSPIGEVAARYAKELIDPNHGPF